MIEKPQVVQTNAEPMAFIHLLVPRTEIQNVMGSGVQEVMSAVRAQGITPTGPWFAHHLKMPATEFDFEICVPVATPIKPAGRVQPGERPAMRVARTTYHGPYDGLPEAWGELDRWIAANALKPAADFYEVYSAGPESSTDPTNWNTQLNRRLLD